MTGMPTHGLSNGEGREMRVGENKKSETWREEVSCSGSPSLAWLIMWFANGPPPREAAMRASGGSPSEQSTALTSGQQRDIKSHRADPFQELHKEVACLL